MTTFSVPKQMLEKIFEQAKQEYPHECCGMIFGPKDGDPELTTVRPCVNVQNEYHEKDSVNFPRTAATAYFIAPLELLKIQKELRETNQEIRIIYHSHINVGAYFSEEDVRMAAPEGEVAYPGVQYLVVSVKDGKIDDHNMFYWDEKKKEFLS